MGDVTEMDANAYKDRYRNTAETAQNWYQVGHTDGYRLGLRMGWWTGVVGGISSLLVGLAVGYLLT